MNSKIVSGVGNIYASEALFDAGVDPRRAAGRISLARYNRLTESIKNVLRLAIKKGGTSLRDFVRESGQPGYFKQELKVYGRAGLPCINCLLAAGRGHGLRDGPHAADDMAAEPLFLLLAAGQQVKQQAHGGARVHGTAVLAVQVVGQHQPFHGF